MTSHRKTSARIFASSAACLLFAVTSVLAQHLPSNAALSNTADASHHSSGVVTVDGVRVDYLDWGGSGIALVFIAGMANTAHVFDDFAPRFTDQFRVLGVTRTGFGVSKQPPPAGYDLASRVNHIRATLDSLRIEQAVLVGHSLGGDEITAFAGTYPDRTLALIYLDAAIDHTKSLEWDQSIGEFYAGAPTPSTEELASASGYQHFMRRLRGVELPIGEIHATIAFDSTGAVRGRRASQLVLMATVNATVRPDFTKVHAPVLALYSDSATAADVLPWLQNKAEENARATAVLDERVWREVKIEHERFAREVKGAQIFSYRAHHYQFLSDPADTERRMLAFLSTLRKQ